LITVIGALATPVSDPMSMFLLMIPLVALYYLSAGIAYLNDKRRAIRSKNSDAELEIAGEYTPDTLDE
jgi:sec-independent protein translocase protein TatC